MSANSDRPRTSFASSWVAAPLRAARAIPPKVRVALVFGFSLTLLALVTGPVTAAPGAALAIDKSHTGDFEVGVPGTYTISVSNVGTADADGPITVTDTLPAGLDYASATGTGWSCSANGQTVTCTNPGPIAPSTSSDITLVVNVRSGAVPSVTNTASVTGADTDPTPNDDSDSDPTTVNPPSSGAEMSITKVGSPNPVNVGQDLTYTITTTNNGPDDATTVVVNDSVPAGVSITSATASQGTCTVTGQDVSCDLGTITATQSATVTLVVVPGTAGQLSNTAQVTSAVTDPDPTNNSATETTQVNDVADLSLTKTHQGDFEVGGQGTYTLTVGNAGP